MGAVGHEVAGPWPGTTLSVTPLSGCAAAFGPARSELSPSGPCGPRFGHLMKDAGICLAQSLFSAFLFSVRPDL